MDINEFVERVQPRKKRSRLIPFANQIGILKTLGYTDLQVRDWLAGNGIDVSREAVRKFIKNSEQVLTQQVSAMAAKPDGTQKDDVTDNSRAAIVKNKLSQADKIRDKLMEQKRAADNQRFKHNK